MIFKWFGSIILGLRKKIITYRREVMIMLTKYDAFNILTGNVPVIVSAPHSAEHMRNGKLKSLERHTRSFGI